MILTLDDTQAFRRRRVVAWAKNVQYWLNEPLRHVADVGGYIADRVDRLCRQRPDGRPVLLDMGFGSAWLLDALIALKTEVSYLGLDSSSAFVEHARRRYRACSGAHFLAADFEETLDLSVSADIVVNAFNFFELCDLGRAMTNVANHLRPGGTLFMSTIDKTYLMLAVSRNWEEFHENLKRYQELPGVKFAFQKIDFGDGSSQTLEYPSVLYSTQDFIEAARSCGLELVAYAEHVFTAKALPKIYCHLEFRRTGAG